MDPSTAQFHQEMSSQTLECILACNKTQQDKKPRPADEQALKCPRCDSTNTKFCYYNNYSLTQPRYFCKSCRRYWTKGGTLRNVPVGGGYRKNKRSSSLKRTQDDQPNQNPLISTFSPFSYDSSTDLSLAFARLQSQTNGQLGYDGHPHMSMLSNPSNTQYCNTPNSGHAYLETTHNGFHNVYYGDQNVGPGFNYGGEENQMGYEESSAIVKQESNKGGIEVERKVFWGLPWQVSGDGDMSGGGGVESVRQSWNGFGSSWHGLLNSPLM